MNWIVAVIIVILLGVAVGMVLMAGASTSTDAWNEAGRLARLTFKQAKRIVILVVGVTLVIVGIVMIVAPGPAIVVIPLGLAVLATEFVWARRLLVRYKGYADNIAKRVGKATPWMPRPWMVGVVIGLTLIGAVVALGVTDWPRHWIVSVTSSLLIMEGVTLYLTISSARGARPANNDAARGPSGDVQA
jgi:uncharacterized protein (TIGR02611 family)